jgi:hypothetical protein
MYRHTQVARVPLAGSLLLAIGTSLIAMKQHSVALFGIPVLLLLAGFLFSSLTVQLRDGELQSHFRFNFWTKRVPLASVTGAEVTQSSAWEGWGIRITPRGMLYNVWGTKAVEVRLQSGERLRLGTDEPGALIKRGALLGLGTRMLSSAVLLLAGAELLELTLGASVGVMAIATVLGFVQSARTTRAITQVRPGSPPLALKLPNPGAKKIIQGGQLALTRDAVTGGIVGDSVGARRPRRLAAH